MTTLGISRRAVLTTGGGLVLALAACSQAVVVRPAPSYEAFAFESSLPAAAAVFVDADQLFREVRMTPNPVDGDSLCDEVTYPVDAREALEVSVVGTLERLVRDVVPTVAPLDRQAMEARGLDAVVVVRADTFNVGRAGRLTSGAFLSFEAATPSRPRAASPGSERRSKSPNSRSRSRHSPATACSYATSCSATPSRPRAASPAGNGSEATWCSEHCGRIRSPSRTMR